MSHAPWWISLRAGTVVHNLLAFNVRQGKEILRACVIVANFCEVVKGLLFQEDLLRFCEVPCSCIACGDRASGSRKQGLHPPLLGFLYRELFVCVLGASVSTWCFCSKLDA